MPARIDDALLLADFRRVRRELEKPTLTQKEYNEHGQYSSATIAHRFGGDSWNKVLTRLGLPLVHPAFIPTNALVADARRVARKFGKRRLIREEYERHGQYGAPTLAKRFGGWNKALSAVGLQITRRKNIPSSQLLADLRRVAYMRGSMPFRRKDYRRLGKFTLRVVEKRYGCWRTALHAAGLQPTYLQLSRGRNGIGNSLRAIVAIPGLTTEDRVKVAKTVDGVKDLADEVIIQTIRRMNLGPVELPSGIPSGVPFWERCITALQKVQPDPEKLRATGVLERLGRQLHRAVALELLGREPLSPTEEQRVAMELRQRRAA